MTEAPHPPKSYDAAERAMLATLYETARGQRDHLQKPFKYRLVSQAQAAPVERAYYTWIRAEKSGEEPVFDEGAMRAAIYNQAAAARQLEAFIHVSRVSVFELCQGAIRGFEEKEVAVPYILLRSLIERTANIAALSDEVKALPSGPTPPDFPHKPLIEVSDRIGRALYGTKVNWEALRDVDLHAVRKDDIAYIHKELTLDVSARNVLTSIDKLGKRVSGARVAYDVLCEFLHPNVGDLYSTTVRATSHSDAFRTRHLVREIGLGPKDLSTAPDLEALMDQVLPVCGEALRLLPSLFGDLHTASLAANRMAKKAAHKMRKRYRSYFRNNDLCPCLSGRKVRDCR